MVEPRGLMRFSVDTVWLAGVCRIETEAKRTALSVLCIFLIGAILEEILGCVGTGVDLRDDLYGPFLDFRFNRFRLSQGII